MATRLDAPRDRLGAPSAWARLAVALVLVPTLVAGAGLLFGAGLAPAASVLSDAVTTVDRNLLDFPPLGDIVREPDERSVVLAADGSVLAVLRAFNRTTVPLDEIPEHVQDAVVATEDARFWDHRGVNWEAVARAAVGNVTAGEITSGASTITQQLVKNLTGRDAQTVERKLQEAVYAIELEERLDKEQILDLYLNDVYLGNGVYGIATAAEFYFGKDVGDLTIPEAALLAGIIRSPEGNNPVEDPIDAILRRNIVLGQMAREEFLTEEQARELKATRLELDLSPLPEDSEPFFVSYVRRLLLADPALGPDVASRDRLILRGGLEIRTTLQPAVQEIAESAVRDVLPDVEGPQAALVAVDPRSGAILAVGFGPKEFGQGPGRTEVLPAVPGVGSSFGRQPGSAFKAFELVAALEDGVSPAYTVDTPSPYVPSGFCAGLDTPWRPGNYSDGGGGSLNMAQATAKSSNVYFAHLVDEFTGPEKLVEVARRMGITSAELQPNCSAVLGGEEVYPLDMASAFGTLANDGIHCRPYAIAEVLDRDGAVISSGGGSCEQAVEPGIAHRATALLRGPIDNGTASRNGDIGRPAAGKTGTTQDYNDAWFAGFIPQLSAATWVGYEVQTPMRDPRCSGGNVTGGCLPTMIWQRFMTAAIAALDLPVEPFPAPPPLPTGTVPDVVGSPVEDAEAVLAEAGFSAEATVVGDYRPAGTVIGQSPAGGTTTETGSLVALTVSDGTGERPVVPNLVGLTEAEARAALAAANLTATVVTVPVDQPKQVGLVVGQRPPPGTALDVAPGAEPDSPGVGEVVIEVGRERTADDPPASPPPSTPETEPPTTPSTPPSPSEPPPTQPPTQPPTSAAPSEPPSTPPPTTQPSPAPPPTGPRFPRPTGPGVVPLPAPTGTDP